MPKARNIHFSRLIKAEGRLKEFNFRRKQGAQGAEYEVDVPVGQGQRYYFTMNSDMGAGWKIRERDIAAWILDLETRLSEAIKEHEQ